MRPVQELAGGARGFAIVISPAEKVAGYLPPAWQVVLAGDPRRRVAEAQQHLMVGGEICLWGEQTDPLNLEQKLWQRAAAVAERLWAPAEALAGCTMPVDLPLTGCWKTAQDRLRAVEVRMRAAGFGIAPSQPLYCTLAPEMCDAYH